MSLRPIITCLVALLLTFPVKGQYRRSLQDFYLAKSIGSGRAWKRISIGLGKFYIPAEIKFKYSGYDPGYGRAIDTTFKKKAKLHQSYVVHAGTFFPITMVSDNSMLSVNVEFIARSTELAYDSLRFMGTGNFMSPIPAYMAGVPISIEYKYGGEVSLDRKDKTMFSLGAGFVPCVVTSDDYNIVKPYRFTPFIKAEFGFLAGIAIKLRGMAFLGTTKYSSSFHSGINNINAYDELRTSTEGSNGYSISLIIMPFSLGWDAGF